MKTINEHFDLCVVAGVAMLLVVAYVFLLAAFRIDNAPIMTLMVSTVGGTIGIATGRKRETNASTESGNVVVKDGGQ